MCEAGLLKQQTRHVRGSLSQVAREWRPYLVESIASITLPAEATHHLKAFELDREKQEPPQVA